MLYDVKSLVAGMSSHPKSRCFLCSVDTPHPLTRPRLLRSHTLTLHASIFKLTTQIPHIAGGSYGDVRPN